MAHHKVTRGKEFALQYLEDEYCVTGKSACMLVNNIHNHLFWLGSEDIEYIIDSMIRYGNQKATTHLFKTPTGGR